MSSTGDTPPPFDPAAMLDLCTRVRAELATAVIGQSQPIDEVLMAIMAGGHCLLQGVPGLAKSLLATTLATVTGLSYRRIQFTPDLMPSDITGTDILQEDDNGRRRFEFERGPVFANLVLADEINRTPPKTQAALLQAMQERQVAAGNRTFDLPDPFTVLATQNPIEQEGTYPLPEAQLDRFLFMVTIDYPQRDDELAVLRRTTGIANAAPRQVMDPTTLLKLRQAVRMIPVSEPAMAFALDLVRSTRPDQPGVSDFVRHWISWGAGPRAGQALVLAAKARALLHGRVHVKIEDLHAVAGPVLRHRIVLNFNASAEGVSVNQVIDRLLKLMPKAGERLL